jgi:hypothetical protein
MTSLTIELPPEAYHRLHKEADRRGKLPQVVAQELLIERLSSPTTSALGREREQVRRALLNADLLAESKTQFLAIPTVRLEEVEASLARAAGKPLSVIVLEQRGPKL